MFLSPTFVPVAQCVYDSLQVAARLKLSADAVKNVIIWGNHSSTQFPDVSHATVLQDGQQKPVYDAVKDDAWLKGDFIKVRPGGAQGGPKKNKNRSGSQFVKLLCYDNTVDREVFARKKDICLLNFRVVLFSSPRHTGSVASFLLFDVEKYSCF